MSQTIIPTKCTLGECLKGHKYDIDFYQRQYVWSGTTVTTLLNDLFYVFERSYEQHKDEDINSGWIDRFEWYYLSTFITNNDNGIEYIIDGQQRLTTMSMIIIKLYHLNDDEHIKNYLKDCICGSDFFTGNIYYIDNDKRKDVMDAIFHQLPFVKREPSMTEINMNARYQDISKYLDGRLTSKKKLKAFTLYLLNRVILVKLDVTPNDTPMVFEVINDRGEALKPFEILKGKLICVISKSENITYSDYWDQAMAAVRGHEDDFFDDYLKSHFVFKSNSKLEMAIKNAYHRYIFSQNDIADTLQFRPEDKDRINHIKSFIKRDLLYYSRLYGKIIQNKDGFLQYDNTINKLSGQYEIILAACTVDDREEDKKIHTIAREYDRMYMVLRLNGAYDSNTFQELSYNLNEKIAGCPIDDYRRVFDDVIKGAIQQRRGNNDEVHELLTKADFSKRGYDNMELRSLRYLLSRIEKWLCDQMHQDMKESVLDISTRTGAIRGYHIEHILSHNSQNRSYFDTDEEFDVMRNTLGGLLLLKGKDNISSGNELYQNKLKTYSSGLVWGHTLAADFYHNNHTIATLNTRLRANHGIEITPVPVFDAAALKSRTHLLYKLVCLIWEL